MDISSITGSAAGLASRSTPPTTTSDPTPVQSTSGPTNADSAKIRDILGQYNIHQISPREFSALVQQLQEQGVISDADLKDLTQIRLELDQAGTGLDEQIDLEEFINEQLQAQQKKVDQLNRTKGTGLPPIDANSFLAPVQRQLALVQKFGAVQSPSSSSSQPLDAVA